MEGKDGPEKWSGISREMRVRLSIPGKVGIMKDFTEEVDAEDITEVCEELPETSSASSDSIMCSFVDLRRLSSVSCGRSAKLSTTNSAASLEDGNTSGRSNLNEG